MSYQVLARKWRPRSFTEMVGQEHVLRALVNALDSQRLHHAFLFTGTRGVGKTSVARIFAKSINCEQGVSSRPCGVCTSCREIDEGRFVDLIEVDGASRTKVEDTRDLLENVQYAPTRGRFKVYLIDEVHMLSNHSFNALLKTLEEPPPHVKFLLATTDPQKLPVTILSRCLQFNLRRLAPELIDAHLARILEREAIPFEPAALREIARAADGSLRDSLSLLDQAIAYGGGRVQAQEVRDMLGTIDRGGLFALLDAVAAGNGTAVLAECRNLAERAPDYKEALGELAALLHRVALAQALPDAVEEELGEGEMVRALALRMSPEDLQLFYQIALIGRRDLPLAPDLRSGFEMVLLRMLAFRPLPEQKATSRPARERSTAAPSVPSPAPLRRQPAEQASPPGNPAPIAVPARSEQAAPARSEQAVPARSEQAVPARSEQAVPARSEQAVPARSEQVAPARSEQVAPARSEQAVPAGTTLRLENNEEWAALIGRLPLTGVTRQFALQCSLVRREGDSFELAVDPAQGHLRNERREESLRRNLEEAIGRPVRLKVIATGGGTTPAMFRQQEQAERQQRAERSIEDDPNVKSLLDRFGGRISPGTVRPLEE